MDFPQSTRVIVVDDKYKEVATLIEAFAKRGVSVLYFDGTKTKLPRKPFSGVRLIFLDLMLKGVPIPDEATVSSTAARVYKALIAEDNGPVVIVLWTKNESYSQAVEKRLRSVVKNPFFIVCINKADCQNRRKRFTVEKIRQQLTEKLEMADVFGLTIAFENALMVGTNKMAARLACLAPIGAEWSNVMSYVYDRLDNAASGSVACRDMKSRFVSACSLYAQGLTDLTCSELRNSKFSLRDGFKFGQAGVSDQLAIAVRRKINAFLFYTHEDNLTYVPGMVFAMKPTREHNDIKWAIVKELFKTGFQEALVKSRDVRLCKIVITPSCDVAKGAILRSGSGDLRELHRVVFGLLIGERVYSSLGKSLNKIISDRYPREKVYDQLKEFEFNETGQDLLVHLGTVSLEELKDPRQSYLFTLKELPLADIQSKAANQFNRIGICAVK